MNCKNCGANLNENDHFCPVCGTAADAADNMNSNKKSSGPLIAIIAIGALMIIVCAIFIIMLLGGGGDNPTEESSAVTAVGDNIASAEPTPTPPPAPVFPHMSATSTRSVDYTSGAPIYYQVENAMDGDYNTCWSPNRNYGLTPTFTISADTPQHVTGIRISNGYFKSPETYTRNRRITRAEIIYEGGSKVVNFNLESYRVLENIVFDQPVDTSYIQIHILDTYYGDWKDICISEIEVY